MQFSSFLCDFAQRARIDSYGISTAASEEFARYLQFEVSVLPYTGTDTWVEDTIINAHHCLQSESAPELLERGCYYCTYYLARLDAE